MNNAERRQLRRPKAAPRGFGIAGVCCISLLPRAPYETTYTPDRPVIGFGFEAQTGTHAFASGRRTPFLAKPNHLSLVPSGCEVYSQSSSGGEYLHIVLSGGLASRCESLPRFTNIIDVAAIDAAEQLRSALISGLGDPLAAEHLVTGLCEHAVRVARGGAEDHASASSMTPRRLQLTLDRIEADMSTRLTVQELASQLGLSAGFFSRAFKAAVGKSPYDYIIDRRIARAREMLPRAESGLADIAQAVGFSSHAHMSAAFRQRLGIPPGAFKSATPWAD